ncbi:MAG TPA: hypothetical protein VFF73_25690 [Planctomycetota bacterium]|nr:hypothetical protein [Planctomycetota bacterium]
MHVDGEPLHAACRAGLGAEPPRVTRDRAGARALLEWLVARVARRRYPVEDLRAGYCSRTPREVLAQASVPFTAPCADMSQLAALLLAEQGFDVTLVLGGIKRTFQPVKFQCGLEVELDGASWVVGFNVGRSVLYQGRFQPTPRRPYVFRTRPEALSLDRSFLTYFVPEGREGLRALIPPYDLERDLRDHVRRSSLLGFFLARRGSRTPSPVAIAAEPSWEAA